MKCKFCQDIRQKIVSKDLNVAYEDEEHGRVLKAERMSMPTKKVAVKTKEEEEDEILGSLSY